jgi:hypothetical protein
MGDLGNCPACGGKLELLDPSDFPGHVPVIGCFHCQKTKNQLEKDVEFMAKAKTIGVITGHAKLSEGLTCPVCDKPLSKHPIVGMGIISSQRRRKKLQRPDEGIAFAT